MYSRFIIKSIFSILILPVIILFPGDAGSSGIQNKPVVYIVKVDGSINPATYEYIHRGINEATENNAECLIIELNTPGGLLKSTRYIVSDLLTSNIPIVVFVSPSGSQAASAGVFVTLAANIAAMAPGTNIGASHPVEMEGKMDSVMSEKATNDAAAFIRSISEKRNRNLQWAEDAVRKSVSISETEALNLKVIDLIATNVDDLLQKIDGREVETAKGKVVLHTKDVQLVNYDMSWFLKFLGIVSDPNVSYIMMMLGIWGILLEFYHPGGILPGVVGVICLILGLYGLHTLPINYAGLGLILLAIILFIAEIKIVSHGLLTIGGVISLLLGSLMLIDVDSSLQGARISLSVIFTTVTVISLLFILLIYLVIKAQKRKVVTGTQGLVGEIGEVFTDIKPDEPGSIKIHGEIWNAEALRNTEEILTAGLKIKVIAVNNLMLTVQKL
jgi:membrane-bound serine protease (ClpP class)